MRASYTQARFNEKYSGVLPFQIFAVSVGLGLLTSSWWIFGIVLFGLMMSIFFKRLALIICVVFSVAWGGIGVGITCQPLCVIEEKILNYILIFFDMSAIMDISNFLNVR